VLCELDQGSFVTAAPGFQQIGDLLSACVHGFPIIPRGFKEIYKIWPLLGDCCRLYR
jgi:hypothetical protein